MSLALVSKVRKSKKADKACQETQSANHCNRDTKKEGRSHDSTHSSETIQRGMLQNCEFAENIRRCQAVVKARTGRGAKKVRKQHVRHKRNELNITTRITLQTTTNALTCKWNNTMHSLPTVQCNRVANLLEHYKWTEQHSQHAPQVLVETNKRPPFVACDTGD